MRLNLLLLSLIAAIMVGCGSGSSSGKRHLHDAIGGAYEIFVITPPSIWQSPIGDTLRYALTRDIEMLNQSEAQFSLINIAPKNFKDLNLRHRNVIYINVADSLQAGVSVEQERYSKMQTLVTFTAPNDSTMISIIDNNRTEIAALFEDMEIKRFNAQTKKVRNRAVCDSVERIFGFTMDIPRGFNIRNIEEPNFIWISYETASVSQGIVIYQYPRTDGDLTSAEILTLKRNEYVSRIPGPAKDTYMKTSTFVFPNMEQFYINEHPWVELTGLWSVENDFMGGPFISYTTINPATNMVITLDFYVYSPKPNKPKRNLLRQLESMVYSVQFPASHAKQNSQEPTTTEELATEEDKIEE